MNPLAVYVHIPFCTVKCGYCDFNAYAGMDALKPEYRAAAIAEIGAWREVLGERIVTSIAFGGGTPGETPADDIAAMIAAVRGAFAVTHEAEISLEANPGTTGAASLARLREAGVTRLSLGAQSFDAGELRFLDRIHSPEAIGGAVALARQAGFESLNLDLIFAIPGQDDASWESSVEHALALHPDHLSLYGLGIEPGTPLAIRAERGDFEPVSADRAADMYEWASDRLAAGGFEQYEISNWAMPGHRSRHNQVYWRGGDYLGIGAGAHGFIGGERFENVAHPRAYIERVRSAGRAIASVYRPCGPTARSDWLMTRLRLLEGFAPSEYSERWGSGLADECGPPLQEAALAGLIELTPIVRLTPRGRLLHGEICARILAHLQSVAK